MPFRSSLVFSHLVVLFLFFHSVVSDSLQPHGLQHTKLPCPSLSPEVCTDSCPLSQWCHPTISPSVAPLLLLPSIFPSLRVGKIEGSSVLSYIETPSKITEFCLHQLQNTREKVGGILDEMQNVTAHSLFNINVWNNLTKGVFKSLNMSVCVNFVT